ncbi:MAG: DUF499 domain-containing protein [Anaerolineae bacterium]|jgi:hypothetical protein|nr:DUF499 domain-containing protein [Anaerolineae bacterium]
MSTQPWHQLCTLRDDVRSGKLTLAEFAADLNSVRTGEAPPVYREPALFFARTYPTYRMKLLARDVLLRLAGQGGKPVLQLQVAYGGGKTHTLIALFHLAECGAQAAEEGGGTVREFLTFAGLSESPRARVALLPFDQFDVKEGLEVYGPGGATRRVMTPWGALAYQLAGDAGYARLKAHDEEFTVPAEPLLVDLLRAPLKEGLGTLVLVDEAVWYYRNLVLSDQRFFGALKDFYQVLTQAVAKVERAVLVAGLIASKIEANDQTGVQCLQALENIFGRIAEPVEPVAREDVAEILRRRLFERVPGEAERRPAVDAMMATMQQLPLRDAQRDQAAYDRLLESYPFHPDLIDVLYQKWTQMSGFQRTRGALRLLAYALRETEGRDPAPMVGPAVLLPSTGGEGGLSPALNELVKICEERERWTPILIGELEKARQIQAALPSLRQREIEAAVVATFLHSQPTGQRAQPSELLALLAHPGMDPAALEEGLRKWRELSWFLVEDPAVWQLGTTPNLTHLHVQAMDQLQESEIDDELRRRIRGIPSLSTADPGVEVHNLPQSPRDVSDDLHLHYLILGPECALEPGKPVPAGVEAYFNEITGPQNPRTYRNNILALAPEVSRLAGLREQVRRWLGWERIERGETYKLLTDLQKRELPRRKQEAAHGLPEAVVAAYNILLAVDETGQVRAQTLPSAGAIGQTPFERIKTLLTEEERLLTTTLDPELILPGSYLELWREGETARRVSDLMAAFGQFPRLPRLLRPAALYDTLARGVREGVLVLRLPRADSSVRTWWRIPPDEEILRRPEMEVQPASLAELHNLDAALLTPERLAELGLAATPLTLAQVQALFDGTTAPRLASPSVLMDALRLAVQQGLLMVLLSGRAYFREPLPEGPLPAETTLLPAPAPLHGADLTPQALSEAWSAGQSTPQRLAQVLAEQRGHPIPWSLLREGVEDALRLRLFELVSEGGPWPCSPAAADQTVFRVVEDVPLTPDMVSAALEYEVGRAPTLRVLKERLERQFTGQRIPDARLISVVDQAVEEGLVTLVDYVGALSEAPNPLSLRVARPAAAMMAEATLSPTELQRLAERVEQLLSLAPELAFTFRISLTAEGERPSREVLARLNEVLDEVREGWKLA